jgi:hypothetical protein
VVSAIFIYPLPGVIALGFEHFVNDLYKESRLILIFLPRPAHLAAKQRGFQFWFVIGVA